MDAVILPRTEKPQLQTMDDADMIAFLQAIEGDAYEIELFVDAFTGLRQGVNYTPRSGQGNDP